MSVPMDFEALLAQNYKYQPAAAAQIVAQEALRPLPKKQKKSKESAAATEGASGGAGSANANTSAEGDGEVGTSNGRIDPTFRPRRKRRLMYKADEFGRLVLIRTERDGEYGHTDGSASGTDDVFMEADTDTVYIIEESDDDDDCYDDDEEDSDWDDDSDSAEATEDDQDGAEGLRDGDDTADEGDTTTGGRRRRRRRRRRSLEGATVEEAQMEMRRREADRRRRERRKAEVARRAERRRIADELAYELSTRTVEYDRHAVPEEGDGDSDDENPESKEARRAEKHRRRLAAILRMAGGDVEDDNPHRRIELERLRVQQEMSLPPQLHEVELGDWEKEIDWEGDGTGRGRAPGTQSLMEESMEEDLDDGADGGESSKSKTKKAEKNSRPNDDGHSKSNSPAANAHAILNRRFNPYLEAMDFSKVVNWEGPGAFAANFEAMATPLILEESVAGRSVALQLAAPTIRPEPFHSSAVFDQRCERELKASSAAAAAAGSGMGNSLNPDNARLEAIIEARQKKRAQMAQDKKHRVTEAMGTLALGGGKGRTITSSLMGPGGTERTGRPSRHGGSSSAHDAEYVEQLELVYNHSMVKPDLKKYELRQFHRPRLPMSVVSVDQVWQFQIRYSPLKMAKARQGADGSTLVGSYNSSMGAHPGAASQAKIRAEADLSPSEGNLVIFEYCEERPPIQLSKGMAAKIVNYYRGEKARCPISAGGGDRPTRKRQAGDKPGGAQANGAQIGKSERPTRLIGPNHKVVANATELIGGIGRKKTQNEKEAEEKSKEPSVDILPEGVTELLHPKVHGPFIGEVEEGVTQSGLICNLFAAPIFRHDPDPSDFLMILGKKPNLKANLHGDRANTLGVILRPLPSSIYTVGQTEPRVKVYAPNTTGEKSFTAPFVTYHIAKALQRTETKEGRGLRFDEIKDRLFANTVLLPNALRQRIKQVAIYDKNTQIWTTKPLGYEEFPGVEALGRRFMPEGVAAYESACAAVRRLCDLGVLELHSGSSSVASVGAAMVYMNGSVNAARERKSKMSKMVEFAKTSKSKTKQKQITLYERAATKLEAAWKDIRKQHDVARFIYEELQLAPWHLTSEFIDVHKHAQGTGMMKLTGLGDPSGLGEGYNFLREVDAKPNKGTGNSDGALNAQIKKITGTENDLRKLTMKQMASLLRSYGMGQKFIDTLKRWDRVHVIRDLSTKAASDGMGDGLERYARGEKMKLSDQKQMYRERIQEIWRRQRGALSTDAGGFELSRPQASSAAASGADADGAAGKEADDALEQEMMDSDDDDDDDSLIASFEEDFMDVKQTNQLVAAQMRGSVDESEEFVRTLGRQTQEDTQEMSKDARELAALKRQREEERLAQEGLLGKQRGRGAKADPNTQREPAVERKVIRRRITKTHPDGTQTTTFKFIVQRGEVDKIIAAKKKKDEKEDQDKDGAFKPKRKGPRGARLLQADEEKVPGAEDEKRSVGHALFEEEDELGEKPRARTNIKLQFQRSTKVIATKAKKKIGRAPPPPKVPTKPKKAPKEINKLKKVSQEKKVKKRKREAEEADLYKTVPQRNGTNNRRQRGSVRERMPHVVFSDRLETIRSQVEKRPGSGPFHRPVSRRHLPTYYEVISEPIDLQTIRDKNQRYEYKTAESFQREFNLMKNNAIKFNGAGNPLSTEATAIYEFVKKTIEDNREELTGMEDAVREQLGSSRKGKGKAPSTPPRSETTGGDEASASQGHDNDGGAAKTANLVLGGIATTVNIGDIQEFVIDGADSDSDDDSDIERIAL